MTTHPPVAGSAEMLYELRRRSTAELVDLLQQRPDLAVPPPASLSALAGRALTRSSMDRALAALTTRELAVLDALRTHGFADAEALAMSVGLPPAEVAAVLAILRRRALVVAGAPVWPLREMDSLHPGGPLQPPAFDLTAQPMAAVATQAAWRAEEFARLTARLLEVWQQRPPARLQAGGLPRRELRRTAEALDLAESEAAVVIETAAVAGLVAPGDRRETHFLPTDRVPSWRAAPLGEQWAQLVAPWPRSPRAAWLVGSRTERGTLRAALSTEVERGWVPRLRQRVLHTLAQLPPGSAPEAGQLHELLTWQAPRAPIERSQLEAVVTEAELLGLTGGRALSDAARLLLDLQAPVSQLRAELSAALVAALPPEVDELIVQGDLTGVVPGRPTPALAALLTDAAELESRGGGLTVRFSPASLRRAVAAGRTDVLADLRRHSITPLPQALEYLISEAARSTPVTPPATPPEITAPSPRPAPTVVTAFPGPEQLARVVQQLRDADDESSTMAPGHVVAALREAAATGQSVEVVLADNSGQSRTRLLRPLGVAAGRARLIDVAAGTQISVAVHHIAAVSTIPARD